MSDSLATRFGSGQSVRRLEDPALVTGRGLYAADAPCEEALCLVLVRSSYAHARIVSIDTAAARAMPGVVAILTGADLAQAGVKPFPIEPAFKRPDGKPMAAPPRRALALDTVRYVGEPVVAVLATTRAEAQDAAAQVYVEYEELPVVADIERATAEDAPLVWPEATGNVAAEMRHGNAAATAAAFEAAAHRVRLKIVNQRLAPSPIEPRASLATIEPGTGRLVLRLSSQMPAGARNTLADAILGIPKEEVRVVVGDVGGGFGMKTGLYPEDAVVAYAARTLQRPVRWTAERSEEFLGAIHGRDLESDAELALDANGRVLALRVASRANVGAYATPTGIAIQLMIGPWVSTSIYDIQTVDLRIQAILTHRGSTGAYRGAGRPEAIYIIERLFDAAARQLAMDPAELRRRNMIRPEQMPYRNALGQTYDVGNFPSILDQGLALAEWNGFQERARDSARRGLLRGRGLATFLEWTGGNALEERVWVTVTPDGTIEIASATQAMGQGIATSYAQLVVDVFGVPFERIRILQGDTDRVNGFGSAGSRSLFTGGSAIRVAAETTLDLAKKLAADALEAPATDLEYRAGRFEVAGTDHGIDLFELAGRQTERRIFVDSSTKSSGPTWPNGCHVCEVEIDPDTGAVEVVAYASVNDVGRVVNPLIVRGQLDGGAVQGIGQALCERVVYDSETGQALTASFLDYALPRADIVKAFKTQLDQSIPSTNNILGVKGVGELGTIGATPAVVNAVLDALDRHGAREHLYSLQMPLTSEKVWRVLRGLSAEA